MTVAVGSELLGIASSAALAAGRHALDGFRPRVPATHKSSFHDIVTAVDRECEEMIVEEIRRRCPDSRIVAEEGGAHGDGDVTWYVDPIDGTNNFARGIPFFCVSIGAAVAGRLEAAAIYDPVRREMFTASRAGAWSNGDPIASRGATTDDDALLLTDFPSPKRAMDIADYVRFAGLVSAFGTVRRLGSGALALAYVACGRADAALMANANAWDLAAGALLIEMAGGRQAGPATQVAPWMGPLYLAATGDLDLTVSELRAFLAA